MRRKFHFIGMGGSGVSGLAEWCLVQGQSVSGSDQACSPSIDRLVRLGARFTEGHDAANISNADLVIHSTAVPADNVELIAARERGLPVLSRGELLGEFSRGLQTIAICGSHGKSTTTALLGCALRAVWPATVYLGAKCLDFGSSVHVSPSPRLIAEVDESDGSFLAVQADLIVLTGLSNDHVSHYGTTARLYEAFHRFIRSGSRLFQPVACIDEPEIERFLSDHKISAWTYGFSPSAHVRASDLRQLDSGCTFRLHTPTNNKLDSGSRQYEVRLPVMGRHNVLNSLAALSAGLQLGFQPDDLLQPLQNFRGVEKRLEKIHENEQLRVYLDYAHNPQKINAALETLAHVYGRSSIICIFQPHRYTRLQSMWDDFLTCFKHTNKIILLPVFSAGESAPSVSILDQFRRALGDAQADLTIQSAKSPEELSDLIFDKMTHRPSQPQTQSPISVTLFLGAGDVWEWAQPFLSRLND